MERIIFCGRHLWLGALLAVVVVMLAGPGTALAQQGGVALANTQEEACRQNRNSERCICWNVGKASHEWVMAVEVKTRTGQSVAWKGTTLASLYLRNMMHPDHTLTYVPKQYPDESDRFQDSDGFLSDKGERITPVPEDWEVQPRFAKFGFNGSLNVEVAGSDPWPGSGTGAGWPVAQGLVRNENYKRDCAFTYLEEDLRRLWQIAGMVVGALLMITVAWAGVVHMQETASGNSYARTRNILVRAFVGAILVGGLYIVVDAINIQLFGMADFWWTQEGRLYEGIIYETGTP